MAKDADYRKYVGARTQRILEAIQRVASTDFSARAELSDRLDEFDALAAGVNMLAEELGDRIEEVKATAAALAEAERVKAAAEAQIVNAMPIGVVLVDLGGRLLRDNEEARKMFGYSSEEVRGKPVTEFIAKKDLPRALVAMGKVIARGFYRGFECTGIAKDGRKFSLIVDGTLLGDSRGESREIILSFRDITELKQVEMKLRKAYEELKSLDKLKTNFMNMAAHELKTPLVPIIGYLNLIDKEKLNADDRASLEAALRNADVLQKLSNDILDIAKLESKAMKFKREEVHMGTLVKNSATDIGSFAREKGIVLKTKIPPRLPPVYGDPGRLAQVLTNLVYNAVKFTDEGSVTVEVQSENDRVVVSVRDTGIGIAEENMPKLFTKFFQVENSARHKYGGTGLGLAICKGIVHAHNGEIWADSGLGKGSTFSFMLPAREHPKVNSVKMMLSSGTSIRRKDANVGWGKSNRGRTSPWRPEPRVNRPFTALRLYQSATTDSQGPPN